MKGGNLPVLERDSGEGIADFDLLLIWTIFETEVRYDQFFDFIYACLSLSCSLPLSFG